MSLSRAPLMASVDVRSPRSFGVVLTAVPEPGKVCEAYAHA